MARRVFLNNGIIRRVRIEEDDWRILEELAHIESKRFGCQISTSEMIRMCIKFTLKDNERLRDAFIRVRRLRNKNRRYKVDN